jgi:hypothetical protein
VVRKVLIEGIGPLRTCLGHQLFSLHESRNQDPVDFSINVKKSDYVGIILEITKNKQARRKA